MGVKCMSDFFEEYGWLLQSFIGGSMGIQMLFKYIILPNGLFKGLLSAIMEGLM